MHRLWNTIIEPLLNELKPKHIVEVGSDLGKNTINILEYCKKNNSKLTSIDPSHKVNLEDIDKEYPNMHRMIEDYSLNVLENLDDYDLILIDGDHNWYTVYNELKSIEKAFKNKHFPFILLHDVSWPYGRRDMYYQPNTIPSKYRLEYKKLGMYPDKSELLEFGGLNFDLYNATVENTPHNGVKTAVEDFVNESTLNLTFHTLDAFHGLGFLYFSNKKLKNTIYSIIRESHIEKYLEKDFFKKLLNVQNTLTLRDNEITELKKINENDNTEIESLTENIEQCNNRINNQILDIENLKRNLDTEYEQNNKLNENSIKKDEIIYQQQESMKLLEERNKSLIQEITKLNEQKQENENIIKEYVKKIDNYSDKLEKSNLKLNENMEKINRIESEKRELINKNEQINTINQENLDKIRIYEEQVKNLKSDLKENEIKINMFKEDNEKLKSIGEALDNKNKKNEKIIKDKDTLIKNKDNQLKNKDNQLKNKDNQLKNKDNQLKNKDTLIKNKDNLIKNNEEEIEILNNKILEKDEDNKKLKFNNTHLNKTNQVHLNIINNQNEKIDEYKEVINSNFEMIELLKIHTNEYNNKHLEDLFNIYDTKNQKIIEKKSYDTQDVYISRILKENEFLKNENKKLLSFKDNVLNSNSWKITGILRDSKTKLNNMK